MEIFDLYNNEGEKLNRTAVRGSKLNSGEFHAVVHIWIRNSEGHYLIQKRNKLTDKNPFMWATTSGWVQSSESSRITCVRETKEEIGIDIDQSQFKLLNRYFVENSHASYITDLYIATENILIKDIVLDKLEVSEVKYASLKEIKQMIKDKQFWNYERIIQRTGYFDLIEKS